MTYLILLQNRLETLQLGKIVFAYFVACWLFLGIGVLLGCSASQSSKDKAKVVVTDAEKGRAVGLRQGQILEVQLESQPGTGYKWYVHPDSTQRLKLVNEDQTKPEKSGFDRPVLQIFRFRAEQSGNGVLRLVYIRPWEKSKPAARVYELNITID
jgi:predicted secreted protein